MDYKRDYPNVSGNLKLCYVNIMIHCNLLNHFDKSECTELIYFFKENCFLWLSVMHYISDTL